MSKHLTLRKQIFQKSNPEVLEGIYPWMLLKRLLFQFTTKRTMAIDIGGMRKPYLGEHQAFEVKDLVSKEPFAQFEHWFEHAKSMKSIEEANAMCVATASKSGIPSARYVLLKVKYTQWRGSEYLN